jgi:hypothetical protein
VLRVAVANAFASVLSSDAGTYANQGEVDPDRIDIDVPVAAVFAEGDVAVYSLPLLDKIAALFRTPISGYRMELVVRATAPASDSGVSQARVAELADNLMQRGLAATALSVGTLEGVTTTAPSLRFTFLLLNADDDLAAVQIMQPTGKAGP